MSIEGGTRHTLKRSLSLPLITLYGLGTTIGAGIYVLVGKMAGEAGMLSPVSFLIGALLVAGTALSFAELSARLPKSAGPALYVHTGFGSSRLALIVGMMVIAAGTVSSAAIANGFVGYFNEFYDAPRWALLVIVIATLGLIAAWGITQSVGIAALVTLMEIGGLLVIIWAASDSFADLPDRLGEFVPRMDGAILYGVFAGAILSFYAFIGFEDMVNVAEEVKDAERNLPRAIILTLVITTVLYMALALAAVLAVPPAELAKSDAPLALVFRRGSGLSSSFISAVAMVSVLNGALIQVIMASRMIYGLSSEGWLPSSLSRVNPITRTPVIATTLVIAAVMALALWLPLVTLAKITSLVMLMIFALVNAALVLIKRRETAPPPSIHFPLWVPAAGFIVSTLAAAFQAIEFAREFL
ncbi:MAG: amino acid permease [Rhodospirillales bacterium]|nr:amino acid permease [Rhodospirillales bacterium]